MNVSGKALKLLEECLVESLHNLRLGKVFLDSTSKAQPNRKKLTNWTSSKLKYLHL